VVGRQPKNAIILTGIYLQ